MTPLQVFESYADAWNRHDADGIVALFVEGGTYCDPTTPGPLTGAAIGEYARGLWSAFPDLSFEMVSAMEGEGGAISAEWLMRGVNSGSMMGLPPTGRAIEVSGVDIAAVADGKLRSVQGYFDSAAVPRALGLDVIVQPHAIGPFSFGTGLRVTNGSKAVPGAFGITFISARDKEDELHIRESSRKILQELLAIPGFISAVTTTVEDRMMTITAWETPESMKPLMTMGEHRAAVGRYFGSADYGVGGMTGVWIPHHLGARRVRCPECDKMASVEVPDGKCTCGTVLPEPLAYW
ncbi:MAG TPA: ester cyclase [Acidobacteriaceae bacterium]|nr:ester cyclase [Acidobacteriaceae bacterium]